MSGEIQRQRNAEIELKKIKSELGENVGETVTIHLWDFIGGDGIAPPPVITDDGTKIEIVLHRYPEDEEK